MNTSAPPLFKQIEAELRQQILSNQLAPGDKLPSESEMIDAFGVSRITVRQALAELHAAGLIQKVNGKGSYVTEPQAKLDLGLLTGFYEYMRARGHVARGKLISVRNIKAPAAATLALGLPKDSTLTRATLAKSVDGSPVAYGFFMGTPELVERLLAHDVEYNDALLLLEARLGYRLHYHDIQAQSVAANKEYAARLDIPLGAPLLRISFVPHDVERRPLIYSEYVFRGDKFSYRARVHRLG